ncbi:tripartite tricarboxylate transporter substrate binding protein [Ramlibacter henchirensis]|uniref:Tripartite tricarboxylate transporter substrate binding protein n=1 Tax=Ramlibacter henchirensis TaxID=204072 RepID=A0A4Z0BXM5_9BURK|nr:tripartite tricarboxylate transporter substrate binding protein [Ramlibacter henchirensis]TFZ03038.1 tripartite tricarboxylate transporter substrate binding protein [Ramlibacter henchirensis]
MKQLVFGAALALAAVPAAFAQGDWPSRPVKLIVNFPAGRPLDVLARSVGEALQGQFKQPFVVENRAGAGGNIGADAVAKAAADGHTVLFGIDSTFTVNPHIYKGMAFKPADLRPLVVMSSSGLLVGVHPSNGFKTMADLVAAGKAKGVSFSSAGSGSPGHLAAEMFTDATGMKITHVPYKGNAPAVTAVLSGEVTGGVLATPGMLPHVKAGKVTPLAVTSRQRSQLAPDVPTVGEAGLPQLEQEVLYVVMVPAATPEPIAQKLQQGVAEALTRPEMRTRLQSLDMHHEGQQGAAAAKRLADLSERYGKVIRATGMKVE